MTFLDRRRYKVEQASGVEASKQAEPVVHPCKYDLIPHWVLEN